MGDRTVRVKWERAGELLRDVRTLSLSFTHEKGSDVDMQTKSQLFDQSVYFSQPSHSPAAAPLPHLPPEGFRLPEKLLTRTDLDQLIDYCTNAVSRAGSFGQLL